MKLYIIIAWVVLILASCSSPQDKSNVNDTLSGYATTTAPPDTGSKNAITSVCFLRTDNKDSTEIELVIKGSSVTGVMNWLPHQKDARKGRLNGKMTGDTIRANWSFMQEGLTDTLELNFLLKNNQLAQKPLKLNKKTGRDQTDESSGYTLKYNTAAALRK